MFLNSISAEEIARTLGGRKVGRNWMAPCPAHKDRTPSLSITDGEGRVLVYCHAGCKQGEVIAALRRRLWGAVDPSKWRVVREIAKNGPTEVVLGRRTEAALAIWRKARPAAYSFVQKYLMRRGITCELPSCLRCHDNLKHPLGHDWPVMIALVTRGSDGTPIAVHRTYLAPDGSWKAPVEPQKMMLGPCRGGAVRLAEPNDLLLIGEGIETSLSVMQATGLPAWAALSTAGLRTLDLPTSVKDVIVIADGDDPGEAAAVVAAQRWKTEGRRVRIARPPRGFDFNDVLMDDGLTF